MNDIFTKRNYYLDTYQNQIDLFDIEIIQDKKSEIKIL